MGRERNFLHNEPGQRKKSKDILPPGKEPLPILLV